MEQILIASTKMLSVKIALGRCCV